MGPLLAVSCDLMQMCESLPGTETYRPHQVQTETKLSAAKEETQGGPVSQQRLKDGS